MSPVQTSEDQGGAGKSAFVERLKLILAHWPSADRLARSMNVSPSAFRKWLKGEAEPSRERLIALARATGVRVAWLAEGEGPAPVFDAHHPSRRRQAEPEPEDSTDWTQFVVPPAASNTQAHLAFRLDWLRSALAAAPEQIVLETAVTDSMAPTIRKGSTLLIDTADHALRNAGIYLLDIGHCQVIARIHCLHDGGIVLLSDNSAIPPDPVDRSAAKDLTVVGRVIWAGAPL